MRKWETRSFTKRHKGNRALALRSLSFEIVSKSLFTIRPDRSIRYGDRGRIDKYCLVLKLLEARTMTNLPGPLLLVHCAGISCHK